MLTRFRHEGAMKPISNKRHRFPPDTIRLPVWLYFRFTTSSRDVEELLAQRGIRLSFTKVTSAILVPLGGAQNTLEADVARRRVHRDGLPRRRTIAAAVVWCTKMGASFEHLAPDPNQRLAWIIAVR
jgi:hypothetical protein